MNLEIVLTGTELLLGEIVDTNSVMVAKMLREIGLDIHYKTVVGDNEQRIIDVLNIALSRVDFVLVSGGLGPTVDDMTRQAVAAATNRELIYSQELEAQIKARFRSFDRDMPENNKRQAWMPEGSIPVENPVGTAPCFIVEDEKGTVICLPGVPRELKHQMENAIMPYFRQRMGKTQLIKARILRTVAIGESTVDEKIDDLMRLSNPTVGLAAHPGQVDIRITAKADTEEQANHLIEPLEADIRERLGRYIFGVDKETLPDVVGQLLQEQSLKLTIIDTISDGALGAAFAEAGYEDTINSEQAFPTLEDMQKSLNTPINTESAGAILATTVAQASAQKNHISISILGPFEAQDGEQVCQVALVHQNQVKSREMRLAYASKARLPWFMNQTLDLIWQAVREEAN
ncbi:MAG: CinA family nicotinamide mononucleotide deamidase-related protein [Chloroflexota bacterium]